MKKPHQETPMMKQYLEIKGRHKDSILFFRMGDFYEMFFEDAVTASKILDIALTARNKSSEHQVPLCGIPYHAVDNYVAKLIKAGKKVAICEQTEDPKKAKGIVKRDVIRVITPGINLDDKILEADSNNYLLAFSTVENEISISFIDVSTEEFKLTVKKDIPTAVEEILTIAPKEIVVDNSARASDLFTEVKEKLPNTLFSFISDENRSEITENELTVLKSKVDTHSTHLGTIQTVLSYLKATHFYSPRLINYLSFYENGDFMSLDPRTKMNLELIDSQNSRETTLFKTLNYTKTPMAKRKLKNWILYPLKNKTLIENRLDCIEYLLKSRFLRDDLLEVLNRIYDLSRLTGKVSQNTLSPKDALALKTTLLNSRDLLKIKIENEPNLMKTSMKDIAASLKSLEDVIKLLDCALSETPPFNLKDGGTIKEGYSKELDDLREIKFNSKSVIAGIETRERKRTSISSLKVKFNKVFGYFIEVTARNLSLVPEDYIRKQTIANGERYITQELKDLEGKILSAQDKIEALEAHLFSELREKVLEKSEYLLKLSEAIATVDTLLSLAIAAEENNYVKPVIENSYKLDIKAGRHPIIERMGLEPFVPNDTYLDNIDQNQIILTGPNMAGKSTIMRQVALIALMGQMGSYVPADSAKIGIIDKLFTRIGASDNLAAGDSTFMVEMKEASYILENATRKSLIILDEIGRGTSTYDGLSLAWGISEHIYKKIKARTLFATHYHELTNLPILLKGIKNFNIAVRQKGESIYFLRKLVEGGVNKSYGIHVARLANLPNEVINSANKKLNELESKAAREKQLDLFDTDGFEAPEAEQGSGENELLSDISLFDTSNSTPLEAMIFLEKAKAKLKGGLTN